MLPVIIEDLIRKVLDTSKHHEQRQHYAAQLRSIIAAATKALETFEASKMWKVIKKK